MDDKTQSKTPIKENKSPAGQKKEIGGTDGPEPTRYGDWENRGIASDF